MRSFPTFHGASAASAAARRGGASAFASASAAPSWLAHHWKTILLALVVLALVAAIAYGIYQQFKKQTATTYHANRERIPNAAGARPTAQIYLFHATWCPACKQAKPAWDSVKAEYDGKQVNGYTFYFVEVDCSQSGQDPDAAAKMQQFGVEGFPTIKIVKDGQMVEFSGPRTKANLTQFIQNV